MAQFNIGILCEKGHAVPQSDEAAFQWYKKSAEQGNSKAQYNTGVMYEKGRGVPPSLAEALLWYMKSAHQGNPMAIAALKDINQDNV
jgi:uncharacterized protein